jgi:signal transduction histidine kinase
MRLRRATSIRSRLMRIAAAITLLTLGIVGTLFVVNDVRMLRGQMVRDLEVLSAVVGENSLSALVFNAPETAEKNLRTLRQEPQIRWAILYDRAGQPFAHYARDTGEPPHGPAGSEEGVFLDVSLLGLGSVEIVRGLELDGEPIGRIFIHARTDVLAEQLARHAWWVGLLLILTLAAALLFAARLQRRISEPILRLAAGARTVSEGGDYSLRMRPPEANDEIAVLFRGFNAMLEQIEDRTAELRGANAKLQQLAREICVVEERERKRLAGELHDSPMQKLALAQLQVASAARHRDAESDQVLATGVELLRDALQELRTLQFELSPPLLYQEGLGAALRWLAAQTGQRFSLELPFVEVGAPAPISQELVVLLFQCTRELVHNLVKHAGARRGRLELHHLGDAVRIVVSDEGRGFVADGIGPREAGEGGYGLYSVRERLALWGGSLAIDSDASGTRATIAVPREPTAPAESGSAGRNVERAMAIPREGSA